MADDQSFGNGERLNIFGCCVPEGMRALYTAWSSVVTPQEQSVFINLSFNRDSPEARVVSFLPDKGHLTVKTKKSADFFLRPPSWTHREKVLAFVNGKRVGPTWDGPGLAYVKFPRARAGDELTITYPLVEFLQKVGIWASQPDLRFTIHWRGNTVTEMTPKGRSLPIGTKINKRVKS